MAMFDGSVTMDQQLPDAIVEEARASEARTAGWGPAKRILFRFGFSYFGLYLLPTFLSLVAFIPRAEVVVGWYSNLWGALVPWVAKRVFHLSAPLHVTGSGDSMYSWMEAGCLLGIALIATSVWTLLARRQTEYTRWYEWLKVYVRFGLATIMIEYGGLKILPSQFPAPSVDRLLQPFGDASPMGLLWTFMGASAAYTSFAGLTEWLGGVLLIFRRTALLGALVCIGALTNVVMLNYCYDVPVKLFSSHLLAMAIFLVAPSLRRLADIFVLNRPVAAAPEPRLVQRRWLRIAALTFQWLFAIGFSIYMVNSAREILAQYYAGNAPLRGIWSVDQLQVDGKAGVATFPWQRVIFDYPGTLAVQLADGSRQRYALAPDTAKKTLALTRRGDPAWKAALAYQQPTPDHLLLEGAFDGHRIRASFHLAEVPRFRLKTRGFHWVNEYPFNY
jgi:hypothetical protein